MPGTARDPDPDAAGPAPPPGGEPAAPGRVETARRRGEELAASARDHVEEARRTSPVVARIFDIVDRDAERLGGLMAGALAYRLFFWLLPFTLFGVGLLGALTSIDDGVPNEVSSDLGFQGAVARAIADGAQQRGWWIAMVVGLSATLWAGVSATKAVRLVHSAAWGLPREKPGSPVRATLGFAAAALAVMGVTVLTGWLREAQSVAGIVATLLIVLVYFVLWMAISRRLPHRPGPWHQLVPGAVLVAIGVQAIHLFTVWYLLDRAERASSTYGAIGTALVILFWLFVVARLIVAAAMLNAELAPPPRSHEAPEETGEHEADGWSTGA